MTPQTATIQEQVFSCENRQDKKNLLKELSQSAKALIELGDERRVNEILIDMYKNEEHNQFENFWQWKKLGFKVKKGEKAFFVWSKKRTGTEKGENGDEDKEFKFFSLAYLFSNAQVEPLKKNDDAKN